MRGLLRGSFVLFLLSLITVSLNQIHLTTAIKMCSVWLLKTDLLLCIWIAADEDNGLSLQGTVQFLLSQTP